MDPKTTLRDGPDAGIIMKNLPPRRCSQNAIGERQKECELPRFLVEFMVVRIIWERFLAFVPM